MGESNDMYHWGYLQSVGLEPDAEAAVLPLPTSNANAGQVEFAVQLCC